MKNNGKIKMGYYDSIEWFRGWCDATKKNLYCCPAKNLGEDETIKFQNFVCPRNNRKIGYHYYCDARDHDLPLTIWDSNSDGPDSGDTLLFDDEWKEKIYELNNKDIFFTRCSFG